MAGVTPVTHPKRISLARLWRGPPTSAVIQGLFNRGPDSRCGESEPSEFGFFTTCAKMSSGTPRFCHSELTEDCCLLESAGSSCVMNSESPEPRRSAAKASIQ